MIDIFAGTSTDHKADFTFCLNACFYFRMFNMTLVFAVLYPVLIALRYLQAKTTAVSNADSTEGDELEGTELYIKANVGFAVAAYSLGLVFDYGLGCALDYFGGYLLYSGVLMFIGFPMNRFVAGCVYIHFVLSEEVHVSPSIAAARELKSVLSKQGSYWEVLQLLIICNACLRVFFYLIVIKSAFHMRFNTRIETCPVALQKWATAFHMRFNTEEATSETESLLQYRHEV